ncbi:hypothetical protein EZS27_026303 [termite gut metagenome]|uniref:AraC-type arabinose-binding/dimerisation domain-containing protein n=1 Tax=termite gut metagenome TaxID=433724 RepID=A0A5J4QSQ2_9ZZZZ
MNQIPVHNIHEKFPTGIFLKHCQDGKITQDGNPIAFVEWVHRDNNYIFLFQEKGEARLMIDFKEYKTTNAMLLCVIPGQIHFGVELNSVSGWFLGVDSLFVEDEWKEVFETVLVSGNSIVPSTEILDDLRFGFALLDRKIQSGNQSLAQHAAILLIGIIAELYRGRLPVLLNKRLTTITLQFKSLLAEHLKTVKSPS